MPTEYVDVVFRAQLANIEKELARLPNTTEKEARAVLRTLNRMAKESDREYKRMAKAAKDAADLQAERWQAVQKVAMGLGGTFSETAGMADDLAEGLGALIGPAGLVAAGFAAAGVAAVTAGAAIFSLVNGADEAIERLQQIEGAEPISPETIRKVDDFEQSLLGAEVAVQQLRLALADDLAPATTTAVDTFAGLVDIVTELHRAWREGSDEAETATDRWAGKLNLVNQPVLALQLRVFELTGGLDAMQKFFGLVAERGREARENLEETTESVDTMAQAAASAAAEWDALMASMGQPTDLESRIQREQAALERTFELARQAKLESGEWSALDAQAAETNLGIQLRAIRVRLEGEEAAKEAREAERRHREWQRQQEAQRAAEREAEAEWQREQAQRDNERAARLQREADINTQLTALIEGMTAAEEEQLSPFEQAIRLYDQQAEAIKQMGIEGADLNLVIAAHAANAEQLARTYEELAETQATAWEAMAAGVEDFAAKAAPALQTFADAAGPVLDAIQAGADARIESLREEYEAMVETHEATMRAREDELRAMLEAGQISDAEFERRMAQLGEWDAAQRESLDRQRAEQEEAALEAFKAHQNAAIAQALISSALAVVNTLGSVPFPANLIAAAGVATLAAFQVKAIADQPPPQFSGGGMVGERFGVPSDHRLIAKRDDEWVMSPRGTQTAGPELLDALNRGQVPMGNVVLRLDRRTLAEAVIDATGQARIRPARGRITGRAPVYGRG